MFLQQLNLDTLLGKEGAQGGACWATARDEYSLVAHVKILTWDSGDVVSNAITTPPAGGRCETGMDFDVGMGVF